MSPLVALMIGVESVTNQRFPVSRKVIALEVFAVVVVGVLTLLAPLLPVQAGASICRENFNLCCGSQLQEITSIKIPSCADNTDESGQGDVSCTVVVLRNGVPERYIAVATTVYDKSAFTASGKEPVGIRYRGVSCQLALPPYVKAVNCEGEGNTITCKTLLRAKDGTLIPYTTTVRVR